MSRRHDAREAALQILYSCEFGGASAGEAIESYFDAHAPEAPDALREFAGRIVHGTTAGLAALDAVIARHSEHWRIERLATIDRLILRMAIWEMEAQPETPAAVIINEAVELARTFSTEASAGFVNGILDAVRKSRERA